MPGVKSFQLPDVEVDMTINPLRGLYRWRDMELAPQNEPSKDSYQRYYWRDLEPGEGQYDFSIVLRDMNKAITEGRKFSFRIRMMSGYEDNQVYMPSWLKGHDRCKAGCGWWTDTDTSNEGKTFIPDWNDPFIISKAEALLVELNKNVTSIGWIDIGMYGQYGEWALSGEVDYSNAPANIFPATLETKKKYIDMHINAFPGRQFVIDIVRQNIDAIVYAIDRTPARPVGLRLDCLGDGSFFNQWTDHLSDWNKIRDAWKKAPFISEFCPFEASTEQRGMSIAIDQIKEYHISLVGNGNVGKNSLAVDQRWLALPEADKNAMLTIAKISGYRYGITSGSISLGNDNTLAITTNWVNQGNAPLYEPYQVEIHLQQGTESKSVYKSSIVLSELLDQSTGEVRQDDVFSVAGLPAGNYSVMLRIVNLKNVDSDQQRPNLRLVNREVDEAGWLKLGEISL
ncbi:MAG: DUF4832 domain-containing protein [Bacteroidetes bacterium]|nr:DUF4832 domain-containing protein [Bacteroidota bacterium]